MVWSGCYVVSLTWPLCTTYSQAGGRSDLRQGVSLTRRLRRFAYHNRVNGINFEYYPPLHLFIQSYPANSCIYIR